MAYVLYHADCYDGFGAAWAFAQQPVGPDDRHFIPVAHGRPMPDIPDNQDVHILDFSYPEEAIRSLCRRSRTVTLLDHHKTAEAALKGFQSHLEPNLELTFDMAHSGAYLAWKHYVGGTFPQLILYLEDRDLWTNRLPFIEEITAFLRSYERTFENFDMLRGWLDDFEARQSAVDAGATVLRFQRQKVGEICTGATRLLTVGGYPNIPVCNVPYVFASDVGAELLSRYPAAPFVGYYFDRSDGIRQWGLRSRKDFDCSVVAVAKGGGGHAQACGFQENLV